MDGGDKPEKKSYYKDHRHKPYDKDNRGKRSPSINSPRYAGLQSPAGNSPHSNQSPRSNGSNESLKREHGNGNGNGNRNNPGPSRGRGDRGNGRLNQGNRPNGKRERGPRIDLVRKNPLDQQNISKFTEEGCAGSQTLELVSNNFQMAIRRWTIYQYAVLFEPDNESTRLKKGLLYPQLEHIRGKIFDGSVLRTNQKLENDLTELTVTAREGSSFKVTIKFTKEEDALSPGFHQVLNILTRRCLERLNLQQVGRNYYDPVARSRRFGGKFEFWPGYLTSIREHDLGLLMTVDFLHKTMRTETVLDMIGETMRSRHANWQDQFKQSILGVTVLTEYTNKTYKVIDVDFDQTPMSTFETRSGPKTYKSYYLEKYGIAVRDERQPLLLAQSNERQKRGGASDFIALIPELCRPTGMTDDLRRNFQLQREASEFTRPTPMKRVTELRNFNQRLKNNEESYKVLREWQLNLGDDLVSFAGRKMDNEIVQFGRDSVEQFRGDWMDCFRNHSFFDEGALSNWILLHPNRNSREADQLFQNMRNSVRAMNFTIDPPQFMGYNGGNVSELINALKKAIQHDPTIILILVENDNAARYAGIKKMTCLEYQVPTQVVKLKTKNNLSVATKIVLQMHAKLGRAPWHLKFPLSCTMIVGYDISKEGKNTFGALVASMGIKERPSSYFSVATELRNNENTSNEMNLLMAQALKQFQEVNGILPTKIFFYRDGVSEGQLQSLIDYEVDPLKEYLDAQYQNAGANLRFTYLVVNKKINTKIFLRTDRGFENPPSGTVVDNTITLPERYDFFLVSQNTRQGTVNPTAYNVLLDSVCLPPQKLQIFTYKLCQMYYNWNGSVRVPAPCQYAKKLAILCAKHLGRAPSGSFNNKLYFL